MDCFDSDTVIYAAVRDHPLGRRVAARLRLGDSAGSVLLLPEVLSKPLREGATDEVQALAGVLAQLELVPLDLATAELATALASRYRLRAADAVHLATAVSLGAERFVTNNRRDVPTSITEVDVVYPANLPEAHDREPDVDRDNESEVDALGTLEEAEEAEEADEAERRAEAERRERRLTAIREHSGALTGVYAPGYLQALREDWPE